MEQRLKSPVEVTSPSLPLQGVIAQLQEVAPTVAESVFAHLQTIAYVNRHQEATQTLDNLPSDMGNLPQ